MSVLKYADHGFQMVYCALPVSLFADVGKTAISLRGKGNIINCYLYISRCVLLLFTPYPGYPICCSHHKFLLWSGFHQFHHVRSKFLFKMWFRCQYTMYFIIEINGLMERSVNSVQIKQFGLKNWLVLLHCVLGQHTSGLSKSFDDNTLFSTSMAN